MPLTIKNVLESRIEKIVTAYARSKHHWLAYKFSSPAHRGVPDHIYIRDGVVFFIEFKQQGKKPTALQHHIHQRIELEGIKVHIIDSIEAGKALFDTHEN